MFMTRQVFLDLMFDIFLETFLRVLGLLFQFTVKLARRTKGLGQGRYERYDDYNIL